MFPDRATLAPFFRGLFGLELALPAVESLIADYFDISNDAAGVRVDWQLIYCTGTRPRAG